jgi:hypothetical protein
MRHWRAAGCSWRTARLTITPSHGSTPEWLATIIPAPSAGTFSIPDTSTRHHIVYRNSKKGRMEALNFASKPKSSTFAECRAK